MCLVLQGVCLWLALEGIHHENKIRILPRQNPDHCQRPEQTAAEPFAADIRKAASGWLADGGSCIAAPDGSWLVEPQTEAEGVFSAELDLDMVRRERQNFDPVGHYSRPDVTRLHVDRRRQSTVDFIDE
jgi:predicted amidohydrolase